MYEWICSYFGGQGAYVWLEKEFGPARLRACAELPLISLCPHRQWNKIISRQKDVGPLLINNDHNLSVWCRKANCEWVTVGWTAVVCCLPEIPALVLLATTKSQAQHCFRKKIIKICHWSQKKQSQLPIQRLTVGWITFASFKENNSLMVYLWEKRILP